MRTAQLPQIRVAVLVMDGVEEAEITEPSAALRAAGANVDVISRKRGSIQAFLHHTPSTAITVDRIFAEASPDEYDALLLPGGALNADALRVVPEARRSQRRSASDKPIAAMCHAPWLLVSADLLEGRTLTSFPTIHDDIENAGGVWLDRAVVTDGNLLTSRQPSDIPYFIEGIIALFGTARTRMAVPR